MSHGQIPVTDVTAVATAVKYEHDIQQATSVLVMVTNQEKNKTEYRKTSNISRTLVDNKIVDNSDVIGASPVGAAPTASSFST